MANLYEMNFAGKSGSLIDSIEFVSSDNISYGPYGGTGGDPWSSEHPGCKLAYFSGSVGDALDSLTLFYECKAGLQLPPQ